MNDTIRCAYCRETIEDSPVVKQGISYCSDACAFEATGRPKPKQCGVPIEEAAREAAREQR